MKFNKLEISKEEVDYLSERFEIRDHSELFTWALKMLHDISKLDEGGWRLSFQKCEVDVNNNKVDYKDYYPIHLASLYNLSPTNDAYRRLPAPEILDEKQKINKDGPSS